MMFSKGRLPPDRLFTIGGQCILCAVHICERLYFKKGLQSTTKTFWPSSPLNTLFSSVTSMQRVMAAGGIARQNLAKKTTYFSQKRGYLHDLNDMIVNSIVSASM